MEKRWWFAQVLSYGSNVPCKEICAFLGLLTAKGVAPEEIKITSSYNHRGEAANHSAHIFYLAAEEVKVSKT